MRVVEFSDSSPDRRNRQTPESIPRTRLEFGELFAEIVEDRRGKPQLFQTVIQRIGSPEILSLSQETSLEEAKRAAELQLRLLAQQLRQRA